MVTFTRQVVSDSEYPSWDTASDTLNGFHVSSEGTIEKEGRGLLQVDFANKYIKLFKWILSQEDLKGKNNNLVEDL